MKLNPTHILYITTGLLILSLCIMMYAWNYTRAGKCVREGFENIEEAVKKNPEEMAYKLLGSVMGQIRKVSKYALDQPAIFTRIKQMRMTPTELARNYLREQQKKGSEQ